MQTASGPVNGCGRGGIHETMAPLSRVKLRCSTLEDNVADLLQVLLHEACDKPIAHVGLAQLDTQYCFRCTAISRGMNSRICLFG